MVSGSEPRQHLVEFYEDACALAGRVVAFLEKPLRDGGAAAAVARPSHLAAFERQLTASGHDVDALIADGRLLLLDAHALLRSLMDGNAIDGDRFRSSLGGEVARILGRAGSGAVHVYGEMVDLLWESGDRDGALQIETLWTEIMGQQPFSLLCGYKLDGFSSDLDGFARVCGHHDGMNSERQHAVLSARLDPAHAMSQLEVRARALEIEVERRKRTEHRMRELLAVTGELAASDDRATIARLGVETGRAAVGADAAGMWILSIDGTSIELVLASESSAHDAQRYMRVPLAAETPATYSIRTGEAVFLASLEEYRDRYPASYAHLEAQGDATAHRAFAILPMRAGAISGVLCYSYRNEHEFEESGRSFKLLLARQCALAFERVRLRAEERAQREAAERSAESEKRSRGDVELLYELIATANRLDSVDEVYRLALRSVMRASSSDRAAILLYDPDGVLRFKAWDGLSDTYRAAVEGHSPWTRDQLYPPPVTVDDTETDEAWAAYRDVFRAEHIRALMFVPIINHERELIGKFMLYRDAPRPFSLRDIQLSATVAVHIAQAVERKRREREIARAYREEREARLLADEATRAREEILSVVSHDLRNPLGAILMSASSLLHAGADGSSDRVRKNVERIHRQAERMARYIRDLVDFGSIEAGRISLERGAHKPETIISAASEMFGPIAFERGLKLETRIWPDLPPVQCDSDRAVQVLTNLVANALKVTPKGGAVSIGAETKDRDVVFYVRDTGPGIDAEDLPNLFERHWRSKSTTYKGAGLGLSIARGIVDAHGGKIWAESHPGAGSTFYFSLSQGN